MTLKEFLLSRIAEDEADIAEGPVNMRNYGLRWDTTRVLAECEAKRRIVDLHARGEAWCDHCGGWGGPGSCDTCPTIQLLALPYADHPDYDAEWKGQAVI